MDWLLDHWEIVLAIFYLAEKWVHISKSPWDDILVDSIVYIATKIYNLFK